MDRLANSLSRSLMWPLLGAALIGIPWAAARWNAPGPQRDVAAVAATESHLPPGRPAADSAQPGFFPLAELSQGPTAGGRPRFVLRTGFPVDNDVAQGSDGLIGPELFGIPRPESASSRGPRRSGRLAATAGTIRATDARGSGEVARGSDGGRCRAAGSCKRPNRRRWRRPPPRRTCSPCRNPNPRCLLPLDEAKPRSEQLEAIARQADRHVRHGFDLAGKGAYFAARAEFVAALRLLAQGLDAEYQTKAHQPVVVRRADGACRRPTTSFPRARSWRPTSTCRG